MQEGIYLNNVLSTSVLFQAGSQSCTIVPGGYKNLHSYLNTCAAIHCSLWRASFWDMGLISAPDASRDVHLLFEQSPDLELYLCVLVRVSCSTSMP